MMAKMSLQARRELVSSVRMKYKKSVWKKKNDILNGFVAATGYQRKYAIKLLNKEETAQSLERKRKRKRKRKTKPKYNQAVHTALITTWRAANEICGKRLAPFLPELVSTLERCGHLSLSPSVRTRLISISAATADRLLKVERQKKGKGISTTKPGVLLKKQIKIRTFNDWDEAIPGFMEGDLVAHCGGNSEGSFLNTLVLTDIVSGWTEFLPLLCKNSANVISSMNIVVELLPFSLLGLDTDNGSEFINYELLDFCKAQKITFTRSRAYKKNDQAHVEEKNGSIVRRLVGYDRYEGMDAWRALADLYAVIRLYVNYFQPSLKLVSKKRDGAKVTKKYDKAQTPCQRLLVSESVSQKTKDALKKEYKKLDPINLLTSIKKYQDAFWQYAWIKPNDCVTMPQIPSADIKQISSQSINDEEKINVPSLTKKYKRSKKLRKSLLRTWRTKKDPFEKVWNNLQLQLSSNPHRTAKSLLEDLLLDQPEEFNINMLRTLQRRVAGWRKRNHDEAKKHHVSMLSKDSVEGQYLSLVMKV